MPGAVSLFAEAYQRQTGGSLTGSESIQALQAAMKKKQVKGNILTTAAQIASERAAPSLAHSARTSQSEQARFQNASNDLVRLANQSGVEEGYARLFRTLNDGLAESGSLVRTLSSAFNDATKFARELLLVPQSFQRMLEGRDSFITQLVGNDKAEEIRALFKDMEAFGNNFSALTTTIANGWKLVFQQMQQIDGLNVTKLAMKQFGVASTAIGAVNSAAQGDYATASSSAGLAAKGYLQTLTSIPRGVLDAGANMLGFGENAVTNALGLGGDTLSRMQAGQGNQNNNTNVTVGDITIQTQATDAQGIASDVGEILRQTLNNQFSDARLNYPSIGR